ncbi:hypothetical protein P0082_07215 [Candidatus Haliotispira prima]|uniref:Uncharacterized protein n=1 Tax=Candidatus Haliotispira prima TaxID=3034016 RepID=A0ABY8ME63_9SPIO|nr:hypothetical protein P0082_07215 [Candidatus Haliotispira prima]
MGFIGVDTAARAGLAKETCEETHERIDGETREGQKEDALWQRCPICHKAIVSHLIGKEYSALDVHIHHTCEEQKQKLLLCHKQEELLYRTPEPFPSGDWDGQTDREILARPKQREEQAAGLCERFGLDAWYPDSVDCDTLFWYNHSLYQGGLTSVKALEYQG